MRILTVENLYPPHAYGGYEDLCAGAVRDWRAAGHTVRVLSSAWRRADVPADAPPPDGEPVERTLPIYWDDHRLLEPTWRTCLAWERRTRRLVARALDEAAPDVVSVWNAAGLSFGMFDVFVERGIPTVLVVLDRWLGFGLQLDRWHARFLGGPGAALAPAVAAVTGVGTRVGRLGAPVVACFGSRYLQEHADRTAPWTFDDQVVVPHGLDVSRYPIDAGHRPAGWHGRLLYVGRLAPPKGVETAIRAMAEVADATLDVVGTGERGYRDHLAAVAADLGVTDRVRFRGEAGPAGLHAAYAAADALVFPSKWQEPFGVVPLEAMAHGLPVIATGTGGSGEFLVDRVTALRYPPGDVAALAGAIRTVAADGALRDRLRATGLEVAAWLDRARTNRELLDWHAWAVARLQGSRPPERPVLPSRLAPT